MNKNPQIFHGEWWVPAVADYNTRMNFPEPKQLMGHEKKYTGTLTYYGNEDSVLELLHVPSTSHYSHYGQNNVMWGSDRNGNRFTLFNVAVREDPRVDMSSIHFVVGVILIGAHVMSIDDRQWKKCVVRFEFLNNWLFNETRKYLTPKLIDNTYHLDAAIGNKTLLEAAVEKELQWKLENNISVAEDVRGITIIKNPFLNIEASNPISLKAIFKMVNEFEQFLSIALYCEQSFNSIRVFNAERDHECVLLIKNGISIDPIFSALVKFDLFKNELPSMLIKWHDNFDKIAPISSYLIDSLQKKSRFDVPDFLIIAQALDGYYKRFVNVKNLKGCRGYELGIKTLLEQFADVDCIKKCKIDPKVLTHSRDKYSHLLLDTDKPYAVSGWDLYWLTEKCKVLLTCCILNLLGLTNEEINLCCAHSPITQIVDSLPPEIE